MMGAGGLLALLGICFLPAAFSEHLQTDLLVAGASLFCLGLLVMAGAVYVKARLLTLPGEPKPEAERPKRRRGGCDLCASEVPAIHCRVHQVHLCGTCLAKHYDFRSCVYVPSSRTSGRAAAKARGA
jgi:hypothetical protein